MSLSRRRARKGLLYVTAAAILCTGVMSFFNLPEMAFLGASRPHTHRELLRLAASEASSSTPPGASAEGQEKVEYADDVMPDVTGAVRLYATHTLCISCLACCCQFKRLLPNVKLEVAFDVWRETRRWVGSGEDVLAQYEDAEQEESSSK
eukprot:TRINITY_DN30793_c0_g1_i1.p1 TRINITY_DN30793_c0_g1~~TRINITY_DN30793_c0_g1_i1.p1  ORF type:complete len:150 (+),score=30.16 TRINITY_DN30793_c0_g1_i1:39-488(+)